MENMSNILDNTSWYMPAGKYEAAKETWKYFRVFTQIRGILQVHYKREGMKNIRFEKIYRFW